MSDHERNRVFALEGLDGVGKTTVGKLLAEQTGGQYLYFMDHNKMKPFRQRFDGAPTPIRFLYYLTATIDAYFQAEKLKQSSDVFVDRTVASLIAYHRAYSLSERWFWLIPHKLVSQIDTMIYFTMSEENRIARLQSRPLTIGDKSSLEGIGIFFKIIASFEETTEKMVPSLAFNSSLMS